MLLDYSSVNDQILMCPTLNPPVRHHSSIGTAASNGRGLEWNLIINGEKDVTPKPLRHLHADVKIGKMRIFDEGEISIKSGSSEPKIRLKFGDGFDTVPCKTTLRDFEFD